jgi:hypothetical protein
LTVAARQPARRRVGSGQRLGLHSLLDAMHARTIGHPDNPGLIACWPGVRQDRMAAAWAELRRRGHPVFRVSIEGVKPGQTRDGWAVAASTDEPVCRL